MNQCLIVSRSGTVVVHVNGQKAGEVSGCSPATGAIAIQSEGSEVHFRNITVRVPSSGALSSSDESAKTGDTDAANVAVAAGVADDTDVEPDVTKGEQA